MAIYCSIYVLLIFAGIFHSSIGRKNSKRNYCIFVFLMIFAMLAFRHPSMGIDLRYGEKNGYLGMFSNIGKSNWDNVFHRTFLNYERGYIVFCKLLSFISMEQQTLLIACAFISISAVSYLVYKYSENPMLSFLIYLGLPVFLMNYSGMRQVLAISVTTISYVFIKNRKLIFFIAAVLLAATFHRSAIFFIIAYPIYYLKAMGKMRWLTVGLLPIVYLLRNPLFRVLSRIFKDDAVPDNNSAVTLFIVFSAVYIFTTVYSDKNNIHNEGLMNLFWLACVCQAFGGIYATAMRVGYYFMVYLILLLPESLMYIKENINDNNKTYTVSTISIYAAFIIYGLYSIYSASWAMSNPYHFFWQVK